MKLSATIEHRQVPRILSSPAADNCALVADHAQGEAGQDRRKDGPPRPLCHVPDGRDRGVGTDVRTDPGADRAVAAGPFAVATAAHSVASKSPDRTGVCCAGRSAPSQRKMVTGPRFSSQIRPNQVEAMAYRASAGPDLPRSPTCSNVLSDWTEPSGESRIKQGKWKSIFHEW